MIALLVIAFLATAGGSFWLGTYYEAQNRVNRMRQFAGMSPEQRQQMAGGRQGNSGLRPQNNGLITGKVDKVTPDTITITTRFGSQKINLTSETVVDKPVKGDINDIKKGSQIFVKGERDKEDKVEAEVIQIISQ